MAAHCGGRVISRLRGTPPRRHAQPERMPVIAAMALLVVNGAQHSGDAAVTIAKAARTAGSAVAIGVGGAIVFLIYLRVQGTALLEWGLQGWLASASWGGKVAKIILGFI